MEGRKLESNQAYSLFMLGTDTSIEGLKPDGSIARLDGYERGETLNAIFRAVEGAEFVDKHIVSGPATKGVEFDQKVAEGVLMALKAISEGYTTIKIAAHSRGAVETIIIAHKIEEILNLIRNKTPLDKFKDEVIRIILEKTDSSNANVSCIEIPKKDSPKAKPKSEPVASEDENVIKFKTMQSKTPNDKTCFETSHQLGVEKLFKALSDPSKISCELFLIDPVPGQKVLGSWVIDKFFKRPAVVKKREIIYLQDERTAYFEPILPDAEENHSDCDKTTPVPGHHGTASGFLDNQGSAGKEIISSDKDETKGNRGKKTRHVQKLVIGKLVEFFDIPPVKDLAEQKEKDKREKVPAIEKTIASFRRKNRSTEAKKTYFIKRYEKINSEREEFLKFRGTNYSGLGLLSGKTRSVLTGLKTSQLIDDVKALHTPPGGFINNEHIQLTIEGSDTNTSFEFLREQFKFYTECFAQPTGTHKDTKGATKTNQSVINYFCKHDTEIHHSCGYFYYTLQAFISKNLTSLLNVDAASLHSKNSSDCITITQLTQALFVAIETYSKKSTNRHSDNAKKLHAELMKVWESVFESSKSAVAEKIQELEEAFKKIAQPELDISLKDKLNELLKHRNSLLALTEQLKTIKDANLINEASFGQFSARLELMLEKSYAVLQDFLAKEEINQLLLFNNFNINTAALTFIPTLDSHNRVQDRIATLQYTDETSSLSACAEITQELEMLRRENDQLKTQTLLKLAAIFKDSRLPALKVTELTQTADVAQILITRFCANSQQVSNQVFERYNLLAKQIKDEFEKKDRELSLKIDEIEHIEKEFQERAKNLKRIQELEAQVAAKDQQAIALQGRIQQKDAAADAFHQNLADLTFDAQLTRLATNLLRANAGTMESTLISIIHSESQSAMRSGPAAKAKLAHTLNIVNTFVEEQNVELRDYDSLLEEARGYQNSMHKPLQRLGTAMLVLAAISIAAAITVGVLTFGLGLVPLLALYAGIAVGTFALLGAGASAAGGNALFKSKQPKIYNTLRDCAAQKPLPIL